MLKVNSIEEINPIWADKVTILEVEDLDGVVELPLLNACKELFKKNIRTIMSSCNKYNLLGYEEYAHQEEYNLTSIMRQLYAYGEGYAYIMIDYDSLDEENKNIIHQMYDEHNELFLYSCTDYFQSITDDEEFNKRCKKVNINEQHYGYRTITIRYPLNPQTTIEEVKNYYEEIVNRLKNQDNKLKTENETRYLLLDLAKKYEKELNANDIEVNNSLFKDGSLVIIDTPLEQKYGISNDSDILKFLFIIAVLDINNLLKEPYELMVLSFEQDYIHFFFNGEEYTITGTKEVKRGKVIKFGNSTDIEKMIYELNQLMLYREVDNKQFLLKYIKEVNNSLKRFS